MDYSVSLHFCQWSLHLVGTRWSVHIFIDITWWSVHLFIDMTWWSIYLFVDITWLSVHLFIDITWIVCSQFWTGTLGFRSWSHWPTMGHVRDFFRSDFSTFGSASQNILKSYLKKSRILPTRRHTDPFLAKPDIPDTQGLVLPVYLYFLQHIKYDICIF